MDKILFDQVPDLFASVGDLFVEKKEELCEMDARLGDGDLGLTMSKGYAALPDLMRAEAAGAAGDVGKMLMKAGMKMSSLVPSTMGFLMSTGVMEGGKALKGKTELDGAALADYLVGFAAGVQKRGKCEPGQRTIYDAVLPAAEAAKAEELHFTDGSTSAEDLVEAAAAQSGESRVNSWFVDQVFVEVAQDLADSMDISEDAAYTLLYNGGYHIYTTMDPEIQEIVETVYEDRSNLDVTSAKGQKLQSGITIIDPSTGNIVAMAGAVGEKEGNLLWNYAVSKRQVGSSMKPLTAYAPAIDAGVVTPATTFDNYPIQLLNGTPWPKNSPNRYTGWTTVRTTTCASRSASWSSSPACGPYCAAPPLPSPRPPRPRCASGTSCWTTCPAPSGWAACPWS